MKAEYCASPLWSEKSAGFTHRQRDTLGLGLPGFALRNQDHPTNQPTNPLRHTYPAGMGAYLIELEPKALGLDGRRYLLTR